MAKLKKDTDVTTDIEVLRQKSNEITEITPDVMNVTQIMERYMQLYSRELGISAIQFGYPLQAHALRINGAVIVMYNIKIKLKFLFQMSNEGCASIKDKRFLLWRPLFGKIEYLDKNLEKHNLWLGKKQIRIAAHERDHADGILISDRGKEWMFYADENGRYIPKGR